MPEKFEPNIYENPEEIQRERAFNSPEEREVTDRTYEQYINGFCLPEQELESKIILDIGSGLSDFPTKANKKFKESGTAVVALDPMYESLGKNFEEFKENAKKANMAWASKAVSLNSTETYEKAYKMVKEDEHKVAGSHQELPFGDENFDLVLANNSITQYKDREITKTALEEALRVVKGSGEVRILPADLRWDWRKKSLYVHTFEAPTSETKEEAKKLELEIGPDREMFEILREIEGGGVNFYAAVKPRRRRPVLGRPSRLTGALGPNYSLILRKDSQLPNVMEEDILEKLSFKDSPDGFHVPSAEIDL
jgi:ubiquinone/menaquinone biosynthesis C-methylase UbiE